MKATMKYGDERLAKLRLLQIRAEMMKFLEALYN